MLKRMECTISGRVQGVLYRDFAARKARGLGIVGTVENLSDGTVRVIGEGEDHLLKKYLVMLKRGSLFSHVVDVETKLSDNVGSFPDFRIIF